MKSITAAFLLLIFSFNLLGGDILILKIEQYKVRKEVVKNIKAGVAEASLTRISVTSKNAHLITWKDSEEFSLNGEMYDIVHTEKISDEKTIYHCLTDNQETKLIDQFNKNSNKKRKNKNNRNSLAKLVKFIERINPIPQKNTSLIPSTNSNISFIYTENYSALSLEISSPPPKTV